MYLNKCSQTNFIFLWPNRASVRGRCTYPVECVSRPVIFILTARCHDEVVASIKIARHARNSQPK